MTTMDLPIYVVTGYMRSGTSMMMQCLSAGGLSPVIDARREAMNEVRGDAHYKPNRHGFFEPSMSDFQNLDFPTQYAGRLIKILRPGVALMRPHPGGYYVVVMRRNKEEISQSYHAFFGKKLFDPYFNNYESFMEWIGANLRNRRDVVTHRVLWYRDVVDDPIGAFSLLKNDGWPIDVDACASQVDEKECRFRLENLTVGIEDYD